MPVHLHAFDRSRGTHFDPQTDSHAECGAAYRGAADVRSPRVHSCSRLLNVSHMEKQKLLCWRLDCQAETIHEQARRKRSTSCQQRISCRHVNTPSREPGAPSCDRRLGSTVFSCGRCAGTMSGNHLTMCESHPIPFSVMLATVVPFGICGRLSRRTAPGCSQ